MRLSHIQVSALTAAVRLLMGVRKHDDQERQGFVLRPLRRMCEMSCDTAPACPPYP